MKKAVIDYGNDSFFNRIYKKLSHGVSRAGEREKNLARKRVSRAPLAGRLGALRRREIFRGARRGQLDCLYRWRLG